MAYSSSEKEFYQKHYQGELRLGQHATLAATRAAHYLPGKRYSLLLSELDKERQYGTAVEVGCADGDCLVFLASEFRFETVIGIDIAFADDLQQESQGVRFMQANFNEPLPLESGTVDVFVAMMVIEHLFNPFHAFKEIKRVLSPTGMAFVNLPLVTSIKNRLRLLLGRLPETSVPFDRWLADEEWDGNHLHYFSMQAIHRLASQCGLQVTRTTGVGSGHRLKSLAPAWLANEVSFVLQHRGAPASGGLVER